MLSTTTPDTPKVAEPSVCELVNERGHSRYVENVMWVGVGKELSAFTAQDEPDLDIDPPSDTTQVASSGFGQLISRM
ncbi:hypothetical protein KCU71_g20967, partial [Aureobasidium melanogenum]